MSTVGHTRVRPSGSTRTNPTQKTSMNDTIQRSDEMYMLHEVLARARMRRAPRWRSLPYRPALRVAANARESR